MSAVSEAVMDEVLTVSGLSKTFGHFQALKNVSLRIARGERRAVIGPNGAGKSTFFNIVAGQLAPTSGRVLIDGKDATGARPDDIWRRGVTRTFQRNQLFQGLRVWENIELACAARYPRVLLHGAQRRRAIETDIADILEMVHLLSAAERTVKELAYGEQRQLELALALAGRPRILLLDEPTAGMSPTETAAMLALMQGLPRDITLLIVEHDMDVIFNLADTLTVMHLGEVLAEGSAEEIRTNERVGEVYMGRRPGTAGEAQ
jgi:branched-chain amino acid transport system ATP-binding protein